MSKLNKEFLVNNGGKLWEKGNVERVYINQGCFDKVFNNHFSEYSAYKNAT